MMPSSSLSGTPGEHPGPPPPCSWAEGPRRDGRPALAATRRQREDSKAASWNAEIAVNEQYKAQAVERAARLLGRDDQAFRLALGSLWEEAFENGRLAALDELQDRFCVCMK